MKFQLTMLGREDQGAQLLTSSTEVEVKTVMHVTNIRNNIAEAKMNFGMINGEEVNHCNSWGQFLRYKPRAPSYLKKYPKTIKIYPKIPKIIVLKNQANYSTHKLPHRESLPCRPISELVCGADIAIRSTLSVVLLLHLSLRNKIDLALCLWLPTKQPSKLS